MVREPTKICTVCRERKPWSAFYRTRTGSPRWACRACESRIAAERLRRKRHDDPERAREVARRSYHRRKADPEWLMARREYQRVLMNRRRRAAGVPKGVERGPTNAPTPDERETVSSVPFAEWLREVLDRDKSSIHDLEMRFGIADRTLRLILNGHTERVELATVERALVADDTITLRELYPDWYEAAA